jgi:ribosomal protein S18 acetylase RimI-like enzyme
MRSDAVVITRPAEGKHWHALEDDIVVGRGYATRRPDGRTFISIDSWRDATFRRLAIAMLSDLPAPVYTLVDENDRELLVNWRRAGFRTHRREREYVIPTDPAVTGLGSVSPPPDVTILPAGQAEAGLLRDLDKVVRAEVDATIGWQSMPAEVLAPPSGPGITDPSRYVVAARDGQYVGLARVAPLPRRSRLGLIAVRASQWRRGIARAMLAEVLGSLHRSGIDAMSAEVDEFNTPAVKLFEGVGARAAGTSLELVRG